MSAPQWCSPRARRVLLALAAVVIPPELDALGVHEELLDEIDTSVRAFPPMIRLALRAGLAAYDLGAGLVPRHRGRRAADLDRVEAARYFELWWSSRISLLHEFAKGIKGIICLACYEIPAVQRSLGYDPHGWIEKVKAHRLAQHAAAIEEQARQVRAPDPLPGLAIAEPRDRMLEPGRAGARRPAGVFGREDVRRDVVLDCDVVIVGSGSGGATAAAELAEGGLDVVVLEEGSYHGTEDFTADASRMVRTLYRDSGATLALGTPPILYQEGRTVGGSSVINGGMAWRTPEHILARWEKEAGLEGMGLAAMAPYFERVERRIHVRHQDPETIGIDNELLRSGAEAKGWRYVRNLRNQVHCAGSNNCAFGCPTGAKQSTLLTYIPRALAFGARIYSDVKVERITREGTRATGVEGVVVEADGRRGRRVRVRAPVTIASCGAIHTPALLARSGFRTASGMLGHNLSLHPNVKVVVLFDTPVRGWEGVHQAYQVREFQDEGLVFAAVNIPPSILAMSLPRYGAALGDAMREYPRMVVAGLLAEDTTVGRVRVLPGGRPQAFYQLTDLDLERFRKGVSLLAEMFFAVGARRVMSPFEGIADLTCPDDARRLLRTPVPGKGTEVVTVHMMGTARMGSDPAQSVTDGHGRFHGAEGLFVADASLFPTPIGVNPAVTIQALATRNAHRILQDWRR